MMSFSEQIPGFYVAHHPWFDTEYGADRLYKVGHTNDLRCRLVDGEYTTAFTPQFLFVRTFETKTKEDAYRLETGVLYCANSRRITQVGSGIKTELVRMGQEEIATLMQQVAGTLGIAGTARINPDYSRPPQTKQHPYHAPDHLAPNDLATLVAFEDQLAASEDQA